MLRQLKLTQRQRRLTQRQLNRTVTQAQVARSRTALLCTRLLGNRLVRGVGCLVVEAVADTKPNLLN